MSFVTPDMKFYGRWWHKAVNKRSARLAYMWFCGAQRRLRDSEYDKSQSSKVIHFLQHAEHHEALAFPDDVLPYEYSVSNRIWITDQRPKEPF